MKIMKIVGASGIVATVLVAASVFLMLDRTTSVVNAAEAIQQSASATSAYQGWIHIAQELPGAKGSAHVNTKDGTVITVSNDGGILRIMYLSPVKKEFLRYDGKSNTLTRNIMDADEAKHTFDAAMITVSPEKLINERRKHAKLTVTQSKEGVLDRFEITPDPTEKNSVTTKEIMLVDPKTKLFQEIRITLRQGGDGLMKFSYGQPEFKSIYELGVPKDAKVVDAPSQGRVVLPTAASRPTATNPSSRPSQGHIQGE